LSMVCSTSWWSSALAPAAARYRVDAEKGRLEMDQDEDAAAAIGRCEETMAGAVDDEEELAVEAERERAAARRAEAPALERNARDMVAGRQPRLAVGWGGRGGAFGCRSAGVVGHLGTENSSNRVESS
jgi:hypothetical protein